MKAHRPTPALPTRVRTVFISDCHLGQKLSRGDELLQFLWSIEPDNLYLVGDFIDTWCLRWKWHWPSSYGGIFERLIELRSGGTKIFYTPGNHDAILRGRIPQIPGVDIANQFIHQTADGRRLLVTHGDLLDSIEHGWKWLSRVGSFGFNRIIDLNLATNYLLRRLGLRPRFYSFWIKRTSKRMLGAFGRFQRKLIQTAVERELDGIICGHVHWPLLVEEQGVVYLNTGDWLENASAIFEHQDGTFELRNHGQSIARLPPPALLRRSASDAARIAAGVDQDSVRRS
jgi:UDP-2,3-diacylglucosamine pyrophosphatase LpxH